MMSKDVDCPYCGFPQNINHDDGNGYDENVLHQQGCKKCGKTFVFETAVSFSYSVFQADCLNGSRHKWEITTTQPKCCSKMECSICGERRELTEEERKQYGVETISEYRAKLKSGKV